MSRFAVNYYDLMTAALLVIGLYGMVGKRNLLKKIIGMNIFQTAIFLFLFKGEPSRAPRCRYGIPA